MAVHGRIAAWIAKTPRKVWGFYGGDGETDEPETLGALTLASRERLDNLILDSELQFAEARRSRSRERQHHSGTRGSVSRRRMERYQGHLGRAIGTTCSRAISAVFC